MTETIEPKQEETPDYESMIMELRDIARRLDNPNTSVEDAVKLHARGMELIANCEAFLAKAELTIAEVHTTPSTE